MTLQVSLTTPTSKAGRTGHWGPTEVKLFFTPNCMDSKSVDTATTQVCLILKPPHPAPCPESHESNCEDTYTHMIRNVTSQYLSVTYMIRECRGNEQLKSGSSVEVLTRGSFVMKMRQRAKVQAEEMTGSKRVKKVSLVAGEENCQEVSTAE